MVNFCYQIKGNWKVSLVLFLLDCKTWWKKHISVTFVNGIIVNLGEILTFFVAEPVFLVVEDSANDAKFVSLINWYVKLFLEYFKKKFLKC